MARTRRRNGYLERWNGNRWVRDVTSQQRPLPKPKPKARPATVLPNSAARGENLVHKLANQLRIATQGPTLQGAQGPRVTNMVTPGGSVPPIPGGQPGLLRQLTRGTGGKSNTAAVLLTIANAIQDRFLDPETLALKRANSINSENMNRGDFLSREQLRNVNAVDPMLTDQQLRDLGHVVPRTAEENAAIKARHDKLRAELPYDEARAARNTGGGYSAAAAPVAPPKTQYELEQEKLGRNASQSEMDRVRDIGLQMFIEKYEQKGVANYGMKRAVDQAKQQLDAYKNATTPQPVKDSTDIKTIGAGATETFGGNAKSIDQSVEARNSDVNKAVDMNSLMRIRNGGQTADPTEPKRQVALSLSKWLDNA